jgi:AraC-like DNA-binding protein
MIPVTEPILEKVIPSYSFNSSFALKEELLPYIKIGWHFHPEYELVLFTESTGKRFIGDHTDNLSPGDLLLIGPNLPHYMRNDEKYYQGDPELGIRCIVVHFKYDFMGEKFFDTPEMADIKKLLQNSSRGIQVLGSARVNIAPKMEELLHLNGYERLRCLLDILHIVAHFPEQRLLSSMGFQNSFTLHDAERVNKVFTYVLQNFTEEISLKEAAAQTNMITSAFCKFFKKRTGKTFSHVLNEIRIGHACKLFIEQGLSVSDVCYSSGYNSLSYFNRQFKANTKYSPLEYRKRFYKDYQV